MNSTTDKIKGAANEAVGSIKEAAGKASDNPKLTAEGQIQHLTGAAQVKLGDAKDAVKKVIDKA